MRYWAADFETTTDPDDCRVWAWGLANVITARDEDDVSYGNDMNGFITRMMKLHGVVFFHNLKFDGTFIINKLFSMGYKWVSENPREGEFTSLISGMGAYYNITVNWLTGIATEFRDSHKKLPFKIEHIAKAFKLHLLKGSIDYHVYRPVGHVITLAELDYLCNDVLILAKALRTQIEQGMTKLTVGSDALAEFKKIFGKRSFEKHFPVLPESMDAEIRRAYRGGFTMVNKKFQGKRVGKGKVYDVNSLYPFVMYEKVLPYGIPKFVEGFAEPTKTRPLAIQSVTFTARIKKNHIPCIQVKGSSRFVNTEYQEHIKEPVTLMCTNIDLELWEEHYDLDIISYNGGWLFHGASGFFDDYIDKWMDVKINNEGALRELAKLYLNSLYGKFATNPNITGKVPTYLDGAVKLVMGAEDTRDPVYTAMGVFITSYARNITIRAAQEHYDVFAYADTDSLHLLIEGDHPKSLEISKFKMGAWKHEYDFEDAVFLRAKQYSEKMNPETATKNCVKLCAEPEHPATEKVHKCTHVTHIAGLPEPVASVLTLDDLFAGNTFKGALKAKNVRGGVVLMEQEFQLQV